VWVEKDTNSVLSVNAFGIQKLLSGEDLSK